MDTETAQTKLLMRVMKYAVTSLTRALFLHNANQVDFQQIIFFIFKGALTTRMLITSQVNLLYQGSQPFEPIKFQTFSRLSFFKQRDYNPQQGNVMFHYMCKLPLVLPMTQDPPISTRMLSK